MELDQQIFETFKDIRWFRSCGSSSPLSLRLSHRFISDQRTAVESALAQHWKNIRLEAQGDLTGHLAKRNVDERASWNVLVQEAKQRLAHEVIPAVQAEPLCKELPALTESIQMDLVRMVMEITFVRFRPPTFFRVLLEVYRAGHLPCGWVGSMGDWPEGELLIH